MHRALLSTALLLLTPVQAAHASETALFESDTVLELSLRIDFDTLCRPSSDPECDFVPTSLDYRDSDGLWHSLTVELRRRDGWRAQFTNCQVPTLFVRFPPEQAAGTPFEGQTTLALTSHCGKGVPTAGQQVLELPSDFEPYVINEYLGYRLYNTLTSYSLQARLARIRYVDPSNPRLQVTRDAFFTEHFDALARRHDATVVPAGQFDPNRLDREAAERLALFQYMIGNTDWSIERQDNILLLDLPDGRQVPVLYDLDQSGLVDTHYAAPRADLPITTVQQRYFMGFCHPGTDWEGLFGEFIGDEDEMKIALAAVPGLRRGDRRMAGVYLDEFFDTLVRTEQRQHAIVDACQPWPQAAH